MEFLTFPQHSITLLSGAAFTIGRSVKSNLVIQDSLVHSTVCRILYVVLSPSPLLPLPHLVRTLAAKPLSNPLLETAQ